MLVLKIRIFTSKNRTQMLLILVDDVSIYSANADGEYVWMGDNSDL